ncbi:MAG: 4-hydroxy-tetrahydrodipicolinate synthase [Alistipes sp.]|nr:4-hydroxy-tetrahydrodipicolinate synthase [Alistipes sp.]MBR0339543.1 4-hydroxy-tetrahydrodipicolinate synthase [Alistipes sp.]
MNRDIFKGLGVALVTPFMENGAVDFAALAKIVDNLVKGGVDYILVLGTTGETPTLTTDERKALVRFVRERVAGRVALMVGIGGNCTRDVVATLKGWDLSGYSAVLSVNPYYNKPNQEGLYQHFKAIAEASPLPVMLYNIPGRTGVNMTPATIARLAADCDNIIGVKEASGDLEQMAEIRALTPSDFLLVSGDDGLTVEVIKRGGVGVISVLANAYPAETKEVVTLALAGNIEEAEQKLNALDGIISALFEEGNPVGIKTALYTKGICTSTMRLPLVSGSEALQAKMKNLIAEYEK